MGRKERRIAEKMQKRIMNSKDIPDDKKQEVADAVGKLDLSQIFSSPEALLDVIANLGHLANYVTEDAEENADQPAEETVPGTSDETEQKTQL